MCFLRKKTILREAENMQNIFINVPRITVFFSHETHQIFYYLLLLLLLLI